MQADFRLGPWRVEPGLNRISCNGSSLRLEPKVMEVLVSLARHPSETLSEEQLLQAVWPETFVSDDVLTRSVSEPLLWLSRRGSIRGARLCHCWVPRSPKGSHGKWERYYRKGEFDRPVQTAALAYPESEFDFLRTGLPV